MATMTQVKKIGASGSNEVAQIESALSYLGMGNAAIQSVLTCWSAYETAVRDVNTFFKEEEQFMEIKKFFQLDDTLNIEKVLQDRIEENEANVVSFIERFCSYIPDAMNPMGEPTCSANDAVEQKLDQNEKFKKQCDIFQEEFSRLSEMYADEGSRQQRADELLTNGHAMELAMIGLAVSFATMVVSYQTHNRHIAERKEIEDELVALENDILRPMLQRYEDTGRINMMALMRAQVKLENTQRKILTRIEEAKAQRNSMGLTSVLNGINFMANAYKFMRIGQAASTSVQAMQGALAVGQGLVAVGSGVLTIKFHGSIAEWRSLKEKVDEKLEVVLRVLGEIEGQASHAA